MELNHAKECIMKRSTTLKALSATALCFVMAGCSTWDSMSSRQKGATAGAGVGGVAGAAISGGSVLGTVGGAAIGGIVGDQIGKRQ